MVNLTILKEILFQVKSHKGRMFTDDQSTHGGLECLSVDLPEKNRVMASKGLLCSQLMAENSDAVCSMQQHVCICLFKRERDQQNPTAKIKTKHLKHKTLQDSALKYLARTH